MSQADRREYFRRRRQKLAKDQDWQEAEAKRKAAWYEANRKKGPRPRMTEEERKERRRQYDQARRAEISNDPAKHEKEKARKRESYHRNRNKRTS